GGAIELPHQIVAVQNGDEPARVRRWQEAHLAELPPILVGAAVAEAALAAMNRIGAALMNDLQILLQRMTHFGSCKRSVRRRARNFSVAVKSNAGSSPSMTTPQISRASCRDTTPSSTPRKTRCGSRPGGSLYRSPLAIRM